MVNKNSQLMQNFTILIFWCDALAVTTIYPFHSLIPYKHEYYCFISAPLCLIISSQVLVSISSRIYALAAISPLTSSMHASMIFNCG